MTLTLAHSAGTGLVIFWAALLALFILWILFLVVAAKRDLVWLLLVLLLPFTSLVLIFLERKALWIFLSQIAVSAMAFYAFFGMDDRPSAEKFQSLWHWTGEGDAKTKTATAKEADPLPARKKRLQQWKRRLEEKQAAIKPNNAAQKAALQRELKEYLEEQEKIRALETSTRR